MKNEENEKTSERVETEYIHPLAVPTERVENSAHSFTEGGDIHNTWRNARILLREMWYQAESKQPYTETFLKTVGQFLEDTKDVPRKPTAVAEPVKDDRIEELEEELAQTRAMVSSLSRQIDEIEEQLGDANILLEAAKRGIEQRDELVKAADEVILSIYKYDKNEDGDFIGNRINLEKALEKYNALKTKK